MTATLPAPQTGFAVKGVPLVLIENYSTGALVARIEKAESAKLSVSFPQEAIYGGNSLYPHDFVDGNRTGSLEIVTTRFQYGLVEAATGATVTPASAQSEIKIPVVGERKKIPAATTYTVDLTNKTTAVADSVKVYYADTGTLFTLDDTTAAEGEYTYDSGTLTFAVADAGKDIVIDYQYEVSAGDLITVLTNGTVPVVKITLANEFQDQNGTKVREAIFVHKARASGSLEHSESRGSAGKPSLTFDLMDPEREDKQLYSMGYTAVA